ncbi:hypothetical protein L3C95_17195 [Chitinophaga filiformis]|uniref:hypothetical protein n=1 Tax=Chitinophaga filiformis TaxID=104663 RepID=UPI001F4522EE|nr:hypothetical protein [Chitinophaga filiformis]MCF6404636.1 hypothetical protein [Chitinophaga filiformis]
MKTTLSFILALLIIPTTALSQITGRYINTHHGGLCSTTITLLPNGVYNVEGGCEGSSHCSIGTWTMKKDTIRFRQIDSTFKVINKVVSTNSGKQSVTVKLFDAKGNNVTSRYVVGQYVKGKGTYTMDLDSTQTKRTDFRRVGGVIALTSLERLLGRAIEIPIDNADTYEIHLNAFTDWILYKNSSWYDLGNFDLINTPNGLVSVRLEPDDNFNLVKKIYKKE